MFIPYGSGIIIFYRAKKLSHRQVRRIDSGTALKKKHKLKVVGAFYIKYIVVYQIKCIKI